MTNLLCLLRGHDLPRPCRPMKRTLAWLAFTILPTTATTYLVLGWVRAW